MFDKTSVTSLDWVTYPMLRFKDAPKVFIHGLTRTDVPTRTARARGRPARASPRSRRSPAAVANAFFDATGVRIREAPMTAGRVRAVLKAAGA